MLLRSAGRCKIITNAMPQSAGIFSKKAAKGVEPPRGGPYPDDGEFGGACRARPGALGHTCLSSPFIYILQHEIRALPVGF